MARTSGTKRKRQDADAHRDAMRDVAMFAAKAESAFYQRIAQIQNDIQSGRHAIYRFTSDREASPAVAPETERADPSPTMNGLGHQDLVHEEREPSNQLTSSNDPAQTPRPIQIDDASAVPVGIPGAKNCLLGISFVFTGDFEGLTREGAKVLVQLLGGRIDDFPTANKTNYVVLGTNVDPYKLEILAKKHIETITEAGLYDLIRTFSRDPPSEVLRIKRQRIEQVLKESVESRWSHAGDRYTDEHNSAWSGEPNAADDALRYAQSRVSLESAYHASAPLPAVSKPPSSVNDSLYSSRASWTPEMQPAAQPPVPFGQKSVLDSDVLKVIAALPAQTVKPVQSTSAAVASTKAPPMVHDSLAKPTTSEGFYSGSMKVTGSLHDLVESDETRDDSYSPPCADVPSRGIDWSVPDSRPKRLRGVSQSTVGPLAHSYMFSSNFDADEDNKSESDYSPPPADSRFDVTSKKALGSGPPTKKPTKKEVRQARHAQVLQEQANAKAARKKAAREAEERRRAVNAANKAAVQKLHQKKANKRAAKKAATQNAATQPQQKLQAPRKSKSLLQIYLDNQDSADPVAVVSGVNAAPLQHAAPTAAPVAPKAARLNQERSIAQQPVRVRQMVQESSADDESWQPTSQIKREPESEPRYSRYNVDTDSRKLLMRDDGGVDIGVNSPPRASERQLPYGQHPLPQQWPYGNGSRVQVDLETSEDGVMTARKRDSQKHATRTQPIVNKIARPVTARHDSVPQETLPPPPRRRIIVDEYGNKYIAIPATGPFADMPELKDLLTGSGEPAVPARENGHTTQARQQPTNVIDLEDSDCYEVSNPPPTAPKAMLSKQKNAAQSGQAKLTKKQKKAQHALIHAEQQREKRKQQRLQNKNAKQAAKIEQLKLPKGQAGSNNIQASEMPTYSPVPYDYDRIPYSKYRVDPIAPYVPELRGQAQPQPPQSLGYAQTPLPPMSAHMQAPLPPPGVPFPPPPMAAPYQPMYGQFPPPPPPMAGFGGQPRPYSAQPGFAPGPVPFQQMPVMPNHPGFPRASPYVQNTPYVQTPVFGQMSMYAPQPSPFMGPMAPAH